MAQRLTHLPLPAKLASMQRRSFILSATALMASGMTTLSAALAGRRLGLSILSYTQRWRSRHSSIKYPAFRDVLDVMDHGMELGLGGLQIGVAGWNLELAHQARASSESYDLPLEGSLRLPQAAPDVERFAHELRIGREAGISVFHCAAGGRRSEVFSEFSDVEVWKAGVRRSLEWAEPVARRLGARLALENHQDFEAAEMLTLVRSLDSPYLGICLDLGNNLALLESPLEVVRALAPYTFSIHLKDVAVCATEEGFEMTEVPLGQGILDLPAMLRILQTEASLAVCHLEMITRDPVTIPCLTEAYWKTLPHKPGADLARTLRLVRERGRASLPRVSSLPAEARLALEEKNILDAIAPAAQQLGFSRLLPQKGLGSER